MTNWQNCKKTYIGFKYSVVIIFYTFFTLKLVIDT